MCGRGGYGVQMYTLLKKGGNVPTGSVETKHLIVIKLKYKKQRERERGWGYYM